MNEIIKYITLVSGTNDVVGILTEFKENKEILSKILDIPDYNNLYVKKEIRSIFNNFKGENVKKYFTIDLPDNPKESILNIATHRFRLLDNLLDEIEI